MNRLLLCLIVLAINGCAFDENRLEDLRFPANLKIRNQTGQELQVVSIYSVPEYENAFILNGFLLEEGKHLDISISESTFDGLVNGYGVIDLHCSQHEKRIQRPGDFKLLPNSSWPDVAIDVVSCTSGQKR